jgi:hypothetical protein
MQLTISNEIMNMTKDLIFNFLCPKTYFISL